MGGVLVGSEQITVAGRRLKVVAAASLLALGLVPLFASSAAAGDKSESEIFPVVKLYALDQAGGADVWSGLSTADAVAVTSAPDDTAEVAADNHVVVKVEQSDHSNSGGNESGGDGSNAAAVTSGDASSSNSANVDV